ncbi:hypothetical protein BN137_3790 [Cronobacter condimenti 1330]|uniref:Uncharacterized protein n=1 Tax=Cronobacter condimenti 1330 TaxID=1073999 RepID=K8AJE2_9ENTR|nr:hypothetical protein [Cronobacter condimenti]ALB61830.1 hypothetical protein AFK62_04660 [Cronobacter condimenti 1330]CCJ74392.1 hypothetical protein BN137_3790 [Cronobacter condimenti 1330]
MATAAAKPLRQRSLTSMPQTPQTIYGPAAAGASVVPSNVTRNHFTVEEMHPMMPAISLPYSFAACKRVDSWGFMPGREIADYHFKRTGNASGMQKRQYKIQVLFCCYYPSLIINKTRALYPQRNNGLLSLIITLLIISLIITFLSLLSLLAFTYRLFLKLYKADKPLKFNFPYRIFLRNKYH